MPTLLEEANEIIISEEGAAGCVTLNRPQRRNAPEHRHARANRRGAATLGARSQHLCRRDRLGRCGRLLRRRGFARAGNLGPHLQAQGACLARRRIRPSTGAWSASPSRPSPSSMVSWSAPASASAFMAPTASPARITASACPRRRSGYFPDDGVCHAFARMPHHLGMYLALTGRAIGPADAYHLGLATHVIAAGEFCRHQSGDRRGRARRCGARRTPSAAGPRRLGGGHRRHRPLLRRRHR